MMSIRGKPYACDIGSATCSISQLYPNVPEVRKQCKSLVAEAINEALLLINSDPDQIFFYKNPTPPPALDYYPSFLAFNAEYKEKQMAWVSIQEFSINEIFSEIRDFIQMWHLAPSTQFVLVIHDRTQIVPSRGKRYFIDALFSKPTRKCPNPLAVARVYFTISVPERLPKYFCVMVTYRFEGFRTRFYAVGDKALRSKDFQRFYIDAILLKKFAFYVRIFECRRVREQGKRRKSTGRAVVRDAEGEQDEEEEELDEEASMLDTDVELTG